MGRPVGFKLSKETLDNKVDCKICGVILKNPNALSKHLKFQHSLKSKDYFDKYLKKQGDCICKVCGKETRFENITKGYKNTCSHKCSGKFFSGDKNHFFGHKHTDKARKLISESREGFTHTEETKKQISDSLSGIQRTPEYCQNMSEVQLGHESSFERNSKIGEKVKEFYKSWRGTSEHAVWNRDRIKHSLEKVCERPNKFEQNCFKALELEWHGKFKYVGDGSVLINFKSPDFINEEDKVIVLCHGIYWHLLKNGFENTRRNKIIIEKRDALPFEKAGYKVIVLWEDEV